MRFAHNKLAEKYPAEVLANFGCNQVEVKMTYRENETWRKPAFLRLAIERQVEL